MNSEKIDSLAKIIWNYHHLNQPLKKADCIFVLGSHDLSVARYAASLFLDNYAPYIIFSGGLGRFTSDKFNKAEAEIFSDIAIEMGVPQEKIIIENKASNTGENISFTKKLLEKKGINFNSFILVQKPYMERRTYATFKILWSNKEFVVSSMPISFDDYINYESSKDNLINIIVGDLQRIKLYYEKGYQIYQEIPENVWSAYEELVKLGYNKCLVK